MNLTRATWSAMMHEKVWPSLPPPCVRVSMSPAMKRSTSSTLAYTAASCRICSGLSVSDSSEKLVAAGSPHSDLECYNIISTLHDDEL